MTGIVIPSEWDDAGNVLALTLQTDQEEEYRLCGENLAVYVQQRVEAVGSVERCPGGGHRLTVRRLSIIG